MLISQSCLLFQYIRKTRYFYFLPCVKQIKTSVYACRPGLGLEELYNEIVDNVKNGSIVIIDNLSFLSLLGFSDRYLFLVAKLLYKRLYLSVCLYVCLYVRFRGKRDFLGHYIRKSSHFLCAHSSCMLASILQIFCPSVCRSASKGKTASLLMDVVILVLLNKDGLVISRRYHS